MSFVRATVGWFFLGGRSPNVTSVVRKNNNRCYCHLRIGVTATLSLVCGSRVKALGGLFLFCIEHCGGDGHSIFTAGRLVMRYLRAEKLITVVATVPTLAVAIVCVWDLSLSFSLFGVGDDVRSRFSQESPRQMESTVKSVDCDERCVRAGARKLGLMLSHRVFFYPLSWNVSCY